MTDMTLLVLQACKAETAGSIDTDPATFLRGAAMALDAIKHPSAPRVKSWAQKLYMEEERYLDVAIAFEREKMATTPKEMAVMRSLYTNHYFEYGSYPDVVCINDSQYPTELTGRVMSGVLASLARKKLIEYDFSENGDRYLYLTDKALITVELSMSNKEGEVT